MLNPAPSSNRADILPSTFTSPVVGVRTPVMILIWLDLPEPLVPMIPHRLSLSYPEGQLVQRVKIPVVILMGNTHGFLQTVNGFLI